MLRDRESIALSELAEELAQSLYRDEIRNGGWVVDLGLLGPGIFLTDVFYELRAGDGGLWTIDKSDGLR